MEEYLAQFNGASSVPEPIQLPVTGPATVPMTGKIKKDTEELARKRQERRSKRDAGKKDKEHVAAVNDEANYDKNGNFHRKKPRKPKGHEVLKSRSYYNDRLKELLSTKTYDPMAVSKKHNDRLAELMKKPKGRMKGYAAYARKMGGGDKQSDFQLNPIPAETMEEFAIGLEELLGSLRSVDEDTITADVEQHGGDANDDEDRDEARGRLEYKFQEETRRYLDELKEGGFNDAVENSEVLQRLTGIIDQGVRNILDASTQDDRDRLTSDLEYAVVITTAPFYYKYNEDGDKVPMFDDEYEAETTIESLYHNLGWGRTVKQDYVAAFTSAYGHPPSGEEEGETSEGEEQQETPEEEQREFEVITSVPEEEELPPPREQIPPREEQERWNQEEFFE